MSLAFSESFCKVFISKCFLVEIYRETLCKKQGKLSEMQISPVHWINISKACATEFFASRTTKKDYAIYVIYMH